jgi:hypothetical protein
MVGSSDWTLAFLASGGNICATPSPSERWQAEQLSRKTALPASMTVLWGAAVVVSPAGGRGHAAAVPDCKPSLAERPILKSDYVA